MRLINVEQDIFGQVDDSESEVHQISEASETKQLRSLGLFAPVGNFKAARRSGHLHKEVP